MSYTADFDVIVDFSRRIEYNLQANYRIGLLCADAQVGLLIQIIHMEESTYEDDISA